MKPYRIPELAKKYVEYDMIQSYTELPAFPDSRTRLLFVFLASQHESKPHSELYALVTALVQLGMDTHDRIDSDSGHLTEREMRSRQLKVLAGDYFSSRFIQLLAAAGQIEMIKRISEGVSEVNRLKVNLYMRMKQLKITAEEYWNQCTQVKTELFQVFTGILDDKAARFYTELLEGAGRCEVALEELSKSNQLDQFIGSWGYWFILDTGTEEEKHQLGQPELAPSFIQSMIDKYEIFRRLHEKLKSSAQHFLSVAARLESDKLTNELNALGESFMRPLIPASPVMGERR